MGDNGDGVSAWREVFMNVSYSITCMAEIDVSGASTLEELHTSADTRPKGLGEKVASDPTLMGRKR